MRNFFQERLKEYQERLEQEKNNRSRAEKSKHELQQQLDEMNIKLDEAGGETFAQAELNKKRERDLARMRRQLEEAQMQTEITLEGMRKKHNQTVQELGEQIEQLQRQKMK